MGRDDLEKMQKMYAVLCAAASEALDLLPDTDENRPARELLQRALYEAEEIYVNEGLSRSTHTAPVTE